MSRAFIPAFPGFVAELVYEKEGAQSVYVHKRVIGWAIDPERLDVVPLYLDSDGYRRDGWRLVDAYFDASFNPEQQSGGR